MTLRGAAGARYRAGSLQDGTRLIVGAPDLLEPHLRRLTGGEQTRKTLRRSEMTIAIGDRIPDVQLKMIDEEGTEVVSTADVLGKGRVVLFGVPAAFSPTCSDVHLPGFVVRSEDIRARGVDRIFCVSVNDPYVMAAWARSQGVGDKVSLLADGNGELARAMGLEVDLSRGGLGTRQQALRRCYPRRRRHALGARRRDRPRGQLGRIDLVVSQLTTCSPRDGRCRSG